MQLWTIRRSLELLDIADSTVIYPGAHIRVCGSSGPVPAMCLLMQIQERWRSMTIAEAVSTAHDRDHDVLPSHARTVFARRVTRPGAHWHSRCTTHHLRTYGGLRRMDAVLNISMQQNILLFGVRHCRLAGHEMPMSKSCKAEQWPSKNAPK